MPQETVSTSQETLLTPPEGECLLERRMGGAYGGRNRRCDICNRAIKDAKGLIVLDGTLFCASMCSRGRCTEAADAERLVQWYAFARHYLETARGYGMQPWDDDGLADDVPAPDLDAAGEPGMIPCRSLT